MAQTFYKKATGLAPTNEPRMRVYQSVEDAEVALDNGDLALGDVVGTGLSDTAGDTSVQIDVLANQINHILTLIPASANTDNLLAVHSEVDDIDKVIPNNTSTSNYLINRLAMQEYVGNYVTTLIDTIEPIGTIKLANITLGWDEHWHECDGTNGTPDMRECVPVGVGLNDTDTIATHDQYVLGQFKDDQMQNHTHKVNSYAYAASSIWRRSFYNDAGSSGGDTVNTGDPITGRHGDVTRTKQKGLVFIMKISNYAE